MEILSLPNKLYKAKGLLLNPQIQTSLTICSIEYSRPQSLTKRVLLSD
jgi:hypothetical protein